MIDEFKIINELMSSNYYSKLSSSEKKNKFNLYLKWRVNGSLDDDLLEAFFKTKVIKLITKPEITNMLELSLHLGRLFHHDKLIHNKAGVCVYDSIFNEFPVGDYN